MMLEGKNAIIYGAGGAIGGAVARGFAREGAKVLVTGRHLASVEVVAKDVRAAGGFADAAEVDALDEEAVERHANTVLERAGSIDISINAITPIPQAGTQGIPLAQLPVDSFTAPITAHMRSQFLTARAAARRMVARKSGVILMNTLEPARLGAPLIGGMGPAWAAMGAFNRNLSAEFGPQGVPRSASVPPGCPRRKRSGSSSVCTPRRWASSASGSRESSRP